MAYDYRSIQLQLKNGTKLPGKGEPFKYIEEAINNEECLDQLCTQIYLSILNKEKEIFHSSRVGATIYGDYLNGELDKIFRIFGSTLYRYGDSSEIVLDKGNVKVAHPIIHEGNMHNLDEIRQTIGAELLLADMPQAYYDLIQDPESNLKQSLKGLSFIDNPPIKPVW